MRQIIIKMNATEKTINTFTTRVRQMILRFNEIKTENSELYAMVDERDQKIKELEEQIKVLLSGDTNIDVCTLLAILNKKLNK